MLRLSTQEIRLSELLRLREASDNGTTLVKLSLKLSRVKVFKAGNKRYCRHSRSVTRIGNTTLTKSSTQLAMINAPFAWRLSAWVSPQSVTANLFPHRSSLTQFNNLKGTTSSQPPSRPTWITIWRYLKCQKLSQASWSTGSRPLDGVQELISSLPS